MGDPSIQELLADAREVFGVFGKAARALTLVDRALSVDSVNVEALILKAAILYDLDRDEEATALYEQALHHEPCSVEALHGLLAAANDQERYADALQLAERAFACVPADPYAEFRENEDYRQRLVAELYNEKAFALWYLGQRDEAVVLLTEEGPAVVPMEIEALEDQLDWLEHHPDSPEE